MKASQRRAMLEAMQLEVWRPRVALPLAAPAWPELPEEIAVSPSVRVQPTSLVDEAREYPQPLPEPAGPAAVVVPLRPSVVVSTASRTLIKPPIREAVAEVKSTVPRFVLQLLQAGPCLLLLEEPFPKEEGSQLLRDLLQAASLPKAQPVTEPITWPLLSGKTSVPQDLNAARQYVQTVLATQQESQTGPSSLWLFGEVAARVGGGLDILPEAPTQLLLKTLGPVLLLPSLARLMDSPAQKAQVWHLLYHASSHWTSRHE